MVPSSALNRTDFRTIATFRQRHLKALVELFVHEGSKVERAAIVSDVRGGDYFEALRAVLEDLDALGLRHRVLFLDAADDAILMRFQETRRRHPLAQASTVERGIALERAVLEPIKGLADVVIDSTGLKAHMLRRRIADEFLPRAPASRLAVSLESFGLKHGPARDADIVFDVRFLPNPHYEPSLRALTGHDSRVVAYVGRDGQLESFYERLEPLLDFLLPQYVAEGPVFECVQEGAQVDLEVFPTPKWHELDGGRYIGTGDAA